jgi:uncharacterized protein (DUF362 family)
MPCETPVTGPVRIYLEKRDCFTYPDPEDYFSPHILYPEYPFSRDTLSPRPNEVYDMVRTSLFGMGLDKNRFGTTEWNPLGDYVKPGGYILLKPNFVKHVNSIGGLDCTVTHPSIIRTVVDYCVIAKARIIEIGDAPIQGCDFDELMEKHGYTRLFYFIRKQGIHLIVTDFRLTISKRLVKGTLLQGKNEDNDISKTIEFDLKENSYFDSLPENSKYRITQYSDRKIGQNHNQEHHKYLIARQVFEADLIINLPKPKTHRFAGITGASKNFIGIASDKEYLPHFRVGAPRSGGDESNDDGILYRIYSAINCGYCRQIEKRRVFMQLIYRGFAKSVLLLHKVITSKSMYIVGQWHGNDTIWRTILDLNLILLYGKEDGNVDFSCRPRTVLTIGDMIIAGEKRGPLEPSPKSLGCILASNNLAVFDYVFCKMTGFNIDLIPSVQNGLKNSLLLNVPSASIQIHSNKKEFSNITLDKINFPREYYFVPNPLWNEVL